MFMAPSSSFGNRFTFPLELTEIASRGISCRCMVWRMRAQQSQMSLHRLQQAVVLSRSTLTGFSAAAEAHLPSLAWLASVSGSPHSAMYPLPVDCSAFATAARATWAGSLPSAASASASRTISSASAMDARLPAAALPWNAPDRADQSRAAPYPGRPVATRSAGVSTANCRAPLYFARATRWDFSSLPVKPLTGPVADRV